MAREQERMKLSAEESLKRMEEFPKRKERFIGVVRRGIDESAEEISSEEIARRVAEIRSGQAVGHPIEEVLAELRERYP